ncbi:MAG: dihydroxy-acid dehydratase [Paracoccaceae bacterium]|nr:dihydroxy-acid dehydratase [Paracoccaceae bacterium]
MIGRDSRNDMNKYGHWPYVAGVAAAALVCLIMFGLAKSIGGG